MAQGNQLNSKDTGEGFLTIYSSILLYYESRRRHSGAMMHCNFVVFIAVSFVVFGFYLFICYAYVPHIPDMDVNHKEFFFFLNVFELV